MVVGSGPIKIAQGRWAVIGMHGSRDRLGGLSSTPRALFFFQGFGVKQRLPPRAFVLGASLVAFCLSLSLLPLSAYYSFSFILLGVGFLCPFVGDVRLFLVLVSLPLAAAHVVRGFFARVVMYVCGVCVFSSASLA